ncbi:MAG TPA: hypothetical protein ENN33_03990 [Ignavibacteria bacterium]|nr:hypothetical protein [Ignavibacteria bacterium]
MRKISWRTETRELSELKPFKWNPRQATEKQEIDLGNSLKKFNLAVPLIINTDNTIIGGHFRYNILSKKDLNQKVDVRIPNRKLTKEEIKELNLRLNKNLGDWDFDLLMNNFEANLLESVGFNLNEFGFNKPEIAEDEYVEKNIKPKTKEGDFYRLGEHWLLCGDAAKQENIKKLMNGQKADMVFADPPYDMNIEVLKTIIKNIILNCSDTNFLLMATDKQLIEIIRAYDYNIHSFIIFELTSTVPNVNYFYRKHIPAIHFSIGKPVLFRNTHEGLTTVISMKYRNTFNEKIIEHEKPVESIGKIIKPLSKRNNIVLDVFGGSGSTLIACEQLDRICCMMEIDPYRCDIIVDRWKKFTGEKAILQQGVVDESC